jgi:hypothetical protein
MRRRSARRLLAGLPLATVAALLALGAAASCGSRTGLLDLTSAEVEGGADGISLFDTREPIDTGADIPSIDVVVPDSPVVNNCPDAQATLIYVIGESGTLYSFNPATASFAPIGPIACHDPETPFSMAVDRQGVAYVVYESGNLYKVSTRTAECTPTAYVPGPEMPTFGMGFVANQGDAGDGETLYVSLDSNTNMIVNGTLGTIDTSTFTLNTIAGYDPPVYEAELTGTGGGQLFAFQPGGFEGAPTLPAYVYEIDPATAKVKGGDFLSGVKAGSGWAFGFWGGDFYLFTGTGPQYGGTAMNPLFGTVVTQFNPSTKALTRFASLDTDTVVGAGVSTCAPQ